MAIRFVKVEKKVCARVPNRGGPLGCGPDYESAVAEAGRLLAQLEEERRASGRGPLPAISITKGAPPMDRSARLDDMASDLIRRNPGMTVKAAHAALTLGDEDKVTPTEKKRYGDLLAQPDAEPDESDDDAMPVAKSLRDAPDSLATRAGEALIATVLKRHPECSLGVDDPRYALAESESLGGSDRAKALYGLLRHKYAEATPEEFAKLDPRAASEAYRLGVL